MELLILVEQTTICGGTFAKRQKNSKERSHYVKWSVIAGRRAGYDPLERRPMTALKSFASFAA